MKDIHRKRDTCVLIPKEVRDAVCVAAENGDGLRTVANRNGLSYAQTWQILAEQVRSAKAASFKKGVTTGRLLMMPNLPKLGRAA